MTTAGFVRTLHEEESGHSPWLLLATIAVFLITAIGAASALSSGLVSTATSKVNAAIDDVTAIAVVRAAAQGYDAVAALPASAEIDLDVAGKTVTAVRTVSVQPGTRTARVTITAGRYSNFDFVAPSVCAADPDRCSIATRFVHGNGMDAPTP